MMLGHASDDGEDYFASMTDMMVGLLFIFLIMVAFFAYKLSRQAAVEEVIPLSKHEIVLAEREELRTTVSEQDSEILELKSLLESLRQNSLANYNQESDNSRRKILTSIRERVNRERPDLDLTIDFERGVLRLQGVDLFASSSTDLLNPATVSLLALALKEQLRCHIYSKHKTDECSDAVGFVETVYVEGHTDSLPMAGGYRRDGINNNLQLSTRRASNTYERLITTAPDLIRYLNPAGFSIMSVSGFGSQRPIAENETRSGRARNRRIDIRIEMYAPRDETEMQTLKQHNAAALPEAVPVKSTIPARAPSKSTVKSPRRPAPGPPDTVTWTEEKQGSDNGLEGEQ